MPEPLLVIPGECLVMLHPGGRTPDPSGAPAIAAWVAARLGIDVVFVGGIGADDHGALLRDRLTKAGVAPTGITELPGLRTATARVDYFTDGTRAFQFDVAGTAATGVPTEALGDLPGRASWLHLSGSTVLFGGATATTTTAAVERARAAGAIVSVDPNLRAELTDPNAHAVLRDLCASADVLFPSADELDALRLDEDELVDRGTVVCRTLDAAGARLRAGAIDVHVPAVAAPDQVVDADGAGDTFAAAVIAARMRGADWVDAMRVAARVVARAIAVEGPMSVALSAADLG